VCRARALALREQVATALWVVWRIAAKGLSWASCVGACVHDRWDEGVMARLAPGKEAALMIPDGMSTCRAAVPSPRDLLSAPSRLCRQPATDSQLPGSRGGKQPVPVPVHARAYGVLQSHPIVNRVSACLIESRWVQGERQEGTVVSC